MSVTFKEKGHKYESLDPSEGISWQSVTRVIGSYKKPFDAIAISNSVSKKKSSKWYGIPPDEIRDIWAAEGNRATTMGTWYHNQREADMLEFSTIEKNGTEVPIVRPLFKQETKIAPEQKLSEGVYPEHFVYLKSAGICGQADEVVVVNGVVDIKDYKTNKEIKTEPYTNWKGQKEMMSAPVNHLGDCNINHYALQMSMYMYMILKHNPKLMPGKMIIQHVLFKKDAEDKYSYPIYAKDAQGNWIVENIVEYEVPYLLKEVRNIIRSIKK